MSKFSLRACLQVAGTLLAGLCAALLMEVVQAPLPWMIGPLVLVSGLSILGMPTAVFVPMRNGAQLTMGAALGMYFTPDVVAAMGSIAWVIWLALMWAFFSSWIVGVWFYRVLSRSTRRGSRESMTATAYFAASVGGAAEMTLAADRQGGQADLVAAAQSVRVVLAAIAVPVAMQLLGVRGSDIQAINASQASFPGLLALFAIAAAGVGAMLATQRPSPWFLGPLLAVAVFTAAGLPRAPIPSWLSHGAQLVIACSLAVRFRRQFLTAAPVWMAAVLTSSLFLLVAGSVVAWLLALSSGIPAATLVLGFAPANTTEMALTAKNLQLGVAIVIAIQVCRMAVVLLAAESLFKVLKRLKKNNAPGSPAPEITGY